MIGHRPTRAASGHGEVHSKIHAAHSLPKPGFSASPTPRFRLFQYRLIENGRRAVLGNIARVSAGLVLLVYNIK
jgi:hypothetical protein